MLIRLSVLRAVLPTELLARLVVVAVILAATVACLVTGADPRSAVVTTLVACAGAVPIARRLTSPFDAPVVQVTVVVVVLVFVAAGVCLGYPALECLAAVLGVLCTATEVARRTTDHGRVVAVRLA